MKRSMVIHQALSRAQGQRIDEARISDRRRIGLLLQGLCANAHLEISGLVIADWSAAHVDRDGVLSGLSAEPVAGEWLPQRALLDLLQRLFRTEGAPAGRGEGRRVARDLFNRWRQAVAVISLQTEVEQLLDDVVFLWSPDLAVARGALAAEVAVGGGRELRVLGPSGFRRAMLASDLDLADLRRRLGSAEARARWSAPADSVSPADLAESGRWRAAVRAWRAQAPTAPDDRLEFARSLYAIGRFEEARRTLAGLRRPAARILTVWCLFRLGKTGSALRILKTVEQEGLTPRRRIQLLAVALRLLENRGRKKEADRWLSRGLRDSDPWARVRARIVAATNAWDRGDLGRMKRDLDRAHADLEAATFRNAQQTDLRQRWHKASGLYSTARGDGSGAVEHFVEALRIARRSLTPFEAGLLWNELALGRAGEGDLAGAERALRHLLRLHRDVQGTRQTASAHFNLAEIRLRRGRLAGLRATLETATTADRQARNWRGLAHDLELWVRYELNLGRPHAALLRARDALEELGVREIEWRTGQLRQLAARALGWLNRPDAAARELAQIDRNSAIDLELEEIPALWALAGDRERALAEVGEGPLSPLWSSTLTGRHPAIEDWSALEQVEPFRAGRFVYDCELIAPGVAPPAVLRRAVVWLREAGAGPLAERLDSRDSSTWLSLDGYLSEKRSSCEAITKLFRGAGYPQARLSVSRRGDEHVLCDGRGGEARRVLPVAGGELVFEAPYLDEAQKVFVQLVADSINGNGRSPRATAESPHSIAGIVGESPVLVDVLDRVGKLAPAGVWILIQGETGTGKELLAKEVVARGPRPQGPYVAINCASISRDLVNSYLFGHVKGSFTGATTDKAGVFEEARGGTVFLDEIGDLPLEEQGTLLRVLQEKEVTRVGETSPRKVDFELVAATNRDLEAMAADGSFRSDLYHRIRGATLTLPPLRERGRDVVLLAEHFLRRMRPDPPMRLSAAAQAQLLGYDWPGNVRELEQTLKVALAYADGAEIQPDDLELPYRTAAPTIGYDQMVLDYRRKLLSEALRAAGGNQAEAARRLGTSRQNMSEWVKKLGLKR